MGEWKINIISSLKRREESLCQQREESLLYNLKRQSDSLASGNEKGIVSRKKKEKIILLNFSVLMEEIPFRYAQFSL